MLTKTSRSLSFVLVMLCLMPMAGAPMSIFDAGRACVFSAVQGVLTLGGKPVTGATIVRKVEWQHEESDQTITDDQGRFQFPAMYRRSAMKLLPVEFVASQDMVAIVDGREYMLWHTTKRQPEENSELRGAPLRFRCELSEEPRYDHSYDASIETVCRWD